MSQCREWINPKEFEEEFGISIPTQDRWRRERYIPFSRVGRNIRYSRTRINEWFKDHDIALLDAMENEKDI